MNKLYFQEKFSAFIEENHPDLIINDKSAVIKAIEERAEKATKLFNALIEEGIHTDAALEHSLKELKEDYIFSKFNYIENILNDNFESYYNELFETNTLQEKVVEYVTRFEGIFEKFPINDDFIDDKKLYYEIIGAIEETLETSHKQNG